MTVLDRIDAEVRTIGGTPWTPWQNPYWKFNVGGPVHPSRDVGGVDQVAGLAAVYACVRLIADAVASLPIHVYRKRPDGGAQRIESSQLLDDPSADASTTLYDWVFQALSSTLLWGNAYGLISSRTGIGSPSGLGYPQTIEWLPPDLVNVQDDAEQPWNPLRAKIFLQGQQLDRSQLVHLRAFVIPGRLAAVSPMRAFAMLHQQGLDTLAYSADWFRNGGFPPGTFKNTAEEVDSASAREIRQLLTDTLRTHQPLVYGRDWEYSPVTVPPSEAAFIEAMQLNATQIAAIYSVPPDMVGGRHGDSLTYSTVEGNQVSLIVNTLRPWLVRMEHLLTSLLPKPQYARFETDALLKTDLETRTRIYQMQRNIGMRSIDEIRQVEDLAPLKGSAGEENMPLEVMGRMAATTRAIPKSMLDSVVLEQHLAAEELKELQKENLAPPPETEVGQTPVNATPQSYLSQQITLARDATGQELPTGYFGAKSHRATNADRERALAWLQAAHVEGCLTDDELEERKLKVRRARVRGQLDDMITDLPPENELVREAEPLKEPERQAGLPPLFGPAAVTLLQERNQAVLNGKAH